MTSGTTVAAFGELMLRLAAPDRERLLQSARLAATFGGAEANVAASLARFGHTARMITVLPDNALGRAAIDQLRMTGVETSAIRITGGRIGLYFLTPGAVQTPTDVLYDRAGSAFAVAAPDSYDWTALLEGADWLHLSGVTPAINADTCAAAIAGARAAVDLGLQVAFDGNFRGKLWALWDGDPAAACRALLETATLAFVNDLDIRLALGETFDAPDLVTRRRQAAKRAFEVFPRLQAMACTVRQMDGSDACTLGALIFTRAGEEAHCAPVRLANMVDRIGGGDAFAAGVLHGWISGMGTQGALEFGLAASVLKHGVPGDFNPATVRDVEAMRQTLMAAGGSDVRR